jgi:hypothetical protein
MPHPASSSTHFDRTAVFETRLRQSGYQQLEPFFVLREGYIQDNRTGGMLKLDKKRLEQIAAIQNQRIHDTGDATPIIIGHTKRNKKENEQPELTGWATRFNVVPFLDGKTYGLQAVPWSRPEKIENFEKYPRRSAELWTDPDLLDPISILGANTPRLDLGLHRLQRDGIEDEVYVPRHNHTGTPLYLEMNMADDNDTDSGSKPADKGGESGGTNGGGRSSALSELLNSPEWKQVQQQLAEFSEIAQVIGPMLQEMQAGQGGPGAPPPGPGAVPPPGPGGPGAMPPGPAPEVPAQMAGHPFPNPSMGHPMSTPAPMPHQPAPPQPAHMNMGGGGTPGGYNNTNMPHQMQRGYDPRDQELSQLRHQVAVMQLSMIESTVNGVLDDLEDKIVIDRPRDFARLVQMSKADMDAEVAYWIQTRKPVEQPVPTEAVPIQFQAGGNQPGAARGAMAPVQLSLQQAHDMMSMQPDPAAVPNNPAASAYDRLVDIVRGRGKGESPMVAYERVMGKLREEQNGTTRVRG